MNLKPTKVGAEPKKIAVLVGLLLVAGYFAFSNRDAPKSPASARSAVNAPEPRSAGVQPAGRGSARIGRGTNSSPREFRPTLKTKDVDSSKVDPTLHLALLAKLKNVPVEAGTRSLFSEAPPPPAEIKVNEPAKIQIAKPVGPTAPAPTPEPAATAAAPEPKAPPIPLKFYGFVSPPKAGVKRAFFLDGEDIIIAVEGDVVKKRYKIVRIGVNSAVLEDTQFKSNNQQTLPLEAEVAG